MQEDKQDSAGAGKHPTSDAPKILIVDDQRFHLMTLHTLLRDRYQTMVAISGEQGIKAAVANQPDLVLLDVNMPGMDGHEVCRQLRENPATRHIPIIFITGMTDVTDEARGFELGAVDYIAKPFNHVIVKARVQTHIRLKRQTDLLEQYAFHDALTGLANRRAFDQRLELEWSRCQRNQSPLSLVMIDIDHFKLYNDHYGHGAGDVCLGEVGRVIMGEVQRSSDLAARYGGEEFVLVLPESNEVTAISLAERVRTAVEARALPHAASKVGAHVTLSIGVACRVPSKDLRPLDLMRAADEALYAAKSEGRNRVRANRSN
jgi:diguanylate cyclase (GGDEF)-like protein